MQFSNKDIQLFNEAGINVENKNYTLSPIGIFLFYWTNLAYIMKILTV